LLTCPQTFEHKGAREAVDILADAFDAVVRTEATEPGPDDGSGTNVSNSLASELADLQRKDPEGKLLHWTHIGNGLVFISLNRPDGMTVETREIAHSILSEVEKAGKTRSRFCNRLLPVAETCYASKDEIVKAVTRLADRHFPKEETQKSVSYAVVYEARSNKTLDRMEVIEAIADLVPKHYKVDLSNPDKAILVQIVKSTCCVGIATDYNKLCKYNMKTLITPVEEREAQKKLAQEATQRSLKANAQVVEAKGSSPDASAQEDCKQDPTKE